MAAATDARASSCSGAINGPSAAFGWGWAWQVGDPSVMSAGANIGAGISAATASHGSRDMVAANASFDTNAQIFNRGTFHPVGARVDAKSENGVQDNISFTLNVLGNPIFQRSQPSYTYTWVQNGQIVPPQTVSVPLSPFSIAVAIGVDGQARIDITAKSANGPASLSLNATPSGSATANASASLSFAPVPFVDVGVEGAVTILQASLPITESLTVKDNQFTRNDAITLNLQALNGSLRAFVDVPFAGRLETDPILSWPAPLNMSIPLLGESACILSLTP